MRPATPGEDETNLQRRGIASLHWDAEDYWWRGLWAGQWHFSDSEASLREMLAEDLEAGRVPLNPRAAAGGSKGQENGAKRRATTTVTDN